MKISKGVIDRPQKVVVYGPEGIGKSTFASLFPEPLFLDVEGGTHRLDVTRLDPPPISWAALLELVKVFLQEKPEDFATLVLDTADWAETMCAETVCARFQKKGIEDFGWSKGYTYLKEEFGKLLNLLEDVVKAGYNVVVLAHAKMRKFEQPDEMGSYDRWEMKLSKQVAPIVKEWADMVLFANYKTYVVAADDQGKKHKAQGGKRVIHTTHHPCWDAKNRHGLADELPFDYSQIASCIPSRQRGTTAEETTIPAAPEPSREPVQAPREEDKPSYGAPLAPPMGPDVPPALAQLMTGRLVTEEEVRKVIADTGYFPGETPWKVMEEQGFVDGWILPHFDYIVQTIEADPDRLPF